MISDFPIGQGNRFPIIEDVLLDQNGRAIDLSAPGTTVKFVMRGPVGCDRVVVNAPADIEDAKGGAVSYSWAANDTRDAGTFLAVWVVAFADGRTMDVPDDDYIFVKIRPKLV